MKLARTTETANAITREYASEDGARMTIVTLKEPKPLAALQESVRLVPGSAAARAAFRNGREDEYIDGMKARYGGEW